MNSIIVSENKILKLSNVLIKEISDEEFEDLYKQVELLDNYLRNKGAIPQGPLIQYMSHYITDNGELKTLMKILRQSNIYLNHIDTNYSMKSVIRVKNCFYARYIGNNKNMRLAYEKINIAAFEKELTLKGDSYTLYINENDDEIVLDVFMEKVEDNNEII